VAPSRRTDALAFLPLAPADLQLLLALQDAPLHGYAMMKAVEEQSGGALRVELGSLYRMIQRLQRDGLLAEAVVRGGASASPGRDRRFYRITALGRAVVAAELERLRGVLALAGVRPMVPRGAQS
jgi:DNA-binding PadR family transcriptional regulator